MMVICQREAIKYIYVCIGKVIVYNKVQFYPQFQGIHLESWAYFPQIIGITI